MKQIIAFILLLITILIKSSRLLQNAVCKSGECLDPKGLCAPVYNCLVDPCSINNGGCNSDQKCISNYCGGCNAICVPPVVGDLCGWPTDSCPVVKCPCLLCPDGRTYYGGCASQYGCTFEYEEQCKLECSGVVPYDRVCVGCDINHCIAYFDGCNNCRCGKNGMTGCTKMFCPVYKPAKCTKCEKGYALNPTTHICEEEVGCGINHCIGFYDGCNWCFCGDNGLAGCTKRACSCYESPKCTECGFGYHLNELHKCIEKKVCKTDKDCDKGNQFLCLIDPVCQKVDADVKKCKSRKKTKVCVRVDGQCEKDEDCDEINGFVCTENKHTGICVKYE